MPTWCLGLRWRHDAAMRRGLWAFQRLQKEEKAPELQAACITVQYVTVVSRYQRVYRDYTSALEESLLQAPKASNLNNAMLCHAMPRAVYERRRRQKQICEAEHVRVPLYIEHFCTWQSWLGRNEGTKESKPSTHSNPSNSAQKINPGSV